MVAQNPITILALQKWSWPLARNLPKFLSFQLPHLAFVVKMGLVWLRCIWHHLAMKHTQTRSKQKHVKTLKTKFEQESLHRFHVRAFSRLYGC